MTARGHHRGRPHADGEVDDDSGRPLTPAERRRLRRLVKEWERYRWAWKLLGRIAAWISGAVAVMWAARDLIARVVKAALGIHA